MGLGLGDALCLFACIFADNGLLTTGKLEHLYSLLIVLFDGVGLQTSTLKTESTVSLFGQIMTSA